MAFSSVIVFIVNVEYIPVPDPKRQAPVASDVQAPDPFSISGKLVRFPQGKGPQFSRVFDVLQEGQHCSELVHGIRRQASGAVSR